MFLSRAIVHIDRHIFQNYKPLKKGNRFPFFFPGIALWLRATYFYVISSFDWVSEWLWVRYLLSTSTHKQSVRSCVRTNWPIRSDVFPRLHLHWLAAGSFASYIFFSFNLSEWVRYSFCSPLPICAEECLPNESEVMYFQYCICILKWFRFLADLIDRRLACVWKSHACLLFEQRCCERAGPALK